MERDGLGSEWLLSNGLPASPVPASLPYRHWGWSFAADSAAASNNCGLAVNALAYSYYLGDGRPGSTSSAGMYSSRGEDRVYGWTAAACSALQPFICEVPATAYPCMPPPSPPMPPPRPPSPPTPPLSSKCELACPLARRLTDGLHVHCTEL